MLFKYINGSKYDILGQNEIYSSSGGIDFDDYINKGKVMEKKETRFSSFWSVIDGDINLDYNMHDNDKKGMLKEIKLFN